MRKSVCIMVVDADERFREVVEDLFEADGYATMGCANGVVALDVLQALRQPAVFIVGDVMSHESAQQIVEALVRHPLYQEGCPIIYLDGQYQALTPMFRAQLQHLGIPVLPKSIPLATLRESVEQIAQAMEQHAAIVAGGKGDPSYRI